MRRKAYISRFFIFYLNPISLGLYGLGCYHLIQYILDGKIKPHIPIFTMVIGFMLLWFFVCVVFTIHMKMIDEQKKQKGQDEKNCICSKQTIFHVMSVFFVAIFLCITGITIGGICCSLQPFFFL